MSSEKKRRITETFWNSGILSCEAPPSLTIGDAVRTDSQATNEPPRREAGERQNSGNRRSSQPWWRVARPFSDKTGPTRTKVFRELRVFGDRDDLESLVARLEAHLSDGWSRDREREATLWCRPGQSQFCFVRRSSSEVPAIVLLMCPAGRELSVTNIVADRRELSVDDYNAILAEFYLKFLHSVAAEAGLPVELTPDERSLEEAFGWRAVELLKRFSGCANKSSTHPADRRRWMEFMIQLHRQPKRDYDFDLLAKWLIADGWPAEKTRK